MYRSGQRFLHVAVMLAACCLLLLTVSSGALRLGRSPAASAQELDIPEATASGATILAPQQIMAPVRVHPGAHLQIDDFYVDIPPGAVEPLQPVLVLHGMGGAGREFSEVVRARCEAEHWVIVAPTFAYGDWRDPVQLTRESVSHFPRINAFLDRLPEIAGMSVRPQAFIYGYSRGAQAANRYALAYPERVAGVAMMSAGTYTLPLEGIGSGASARALPFPYGVSNLADVFGRPFDASTFARIPFWVGVGGRDDDPNEVPHQWDAYIGDDRRERAERFTDWLQQSGVSAELHVFPANGHGLTPDVANAAMDFIAAHD